MASIHLLPNELLPLIFKHLDLEDLPNCRLVSQKWKFFVDHVRIKELIIAASITYWSNTSWYLTDAKINPRNRILFSQVQRCPFALTGVERLSIDQTVVCSEFDLSEFLAKFPKLCHLEIRDVLGNDTTFNFDLPATLKTIRFKDVRDMKLHLNAPQLQNVFCGYGFEMIEFSHPESVKHLRIEWLGTGYNLQVLPNVESFHCVGFYARWDDANLDFVRLFPKAKEIHFNLGVSFDELERVINAAIEQKNIQRRTDLTIFCGGSKMVDTNSLRSYINQRWEIRCRQISN